MSYHQQQQKRRRFIAPEVGSIHRATVTRIEPYGCFVKFINNTDSSSIPLSGLVHISQLTSITNNGVKISDVNDVVSVDDQVYVKVMDVTVEETEDGLRQQKQQRHKLKLSMKYVHQDTGQDLDADGELMEQDLLRSSRHNNNRQNYNNNNADEDGTGGANSLLGRSLASNIGISSAIDPGSLILKGRKSGSSAAANSTNFNGYYLLVGEEEGEEEAPAISMRDELPSLQPVRPMGRGRATTLPAWMTRQDDNDDRLGSMKDEKGPGREDEEDDSSSSTRGDHHRKKKKTKSSRRDNTKHHKHKDRKRRSKRSSSSRKHSRKDKPSRRNRSASRGRSRSESYYSTSSDDYHSRSRSRSPSYKTKTKKSKHKHRHHHHQNHHRHRGDRKDYSRSRSRSVSIVNRGRSSSPSEFTNVEEARAIIARLERRQREE